MGKYIKYIDENEEIRSGYKVSSNRKKVRNVQIGLLEELKRICKKHSIKYYAYGGTLLGAIRHGGYIPWDDDMDIAMFREDYEKFRKVAEKELPNNIKLISIFLGFSKLMNINTVAFGNDSWENEYFNGGGICIDIFPMDIASKFNAINKIKNLILDTITSILVLQKTSWSTDKAARWKRPFIPICKLIFGKDDYSRAHHIQEKIIKNIFFKGEYIHMFTHRFFPISIFEKSHDVKFENTTICIPNQYDKFLKLTYGNYMNPIIREGGHNCRYSVKKSYKDIIKTLDKSKSYEEIFSNNKDFFVI